MKRLVAFSVVVLWSALVLAQDQQREVVVVNSTGFDVVEVYASPDFDDSWGDGHLVGATIAPNNQHTVRFTGYGQHCHYDVKVVAQFGVEKEYESRDLCDFGDGRIIEFQGDYRSFVVDNVSDEAVFFVYLRSSGGPEWGDDLLGDGVISAGQQRDVAFEGFGRECNFDVRIQTEDRHRQDYLDMNLCRADNIVYEGQANDSIDPEAAEERYQVGDRFRDCETCPWVVVVPGGSYRRGSTQGDSDEMPVTAVNIAGMFAVGEFEVTVLQFQNFVRSAHHVAGDSCHIRRTGGWVDTGGFGWGNPGYGQNDAHPVVCVSWEDAAAYAQWLSDSTGKRYRLLSESEWEYLAQSVDTTGFSQANRANCRGCGSSVGRGTTPVGIFDEDKWGLRDLYGNVWEWVQDCYASGYSSAPRDGSAWNVQGCRQRVRRGGSWYSRPDSLRAALRKSHDAGSRYSNVGFRVARELASSSQAPSTADEHRRPNEPSQPAEPPSPDTDYRLISKVAAIYPPRAEQNETEGYAVVQFTISPYGTVRNPVVVQSVPRGVFDDAAIYAIKQFRYSPRIVNGQAVEANNVRVRFSFGLSDR